jgi:lysophospholipase L1-like esterase
MRVAVLAVVLCAALGVLGASPAAARPSGTHLAGTQPAGTPAGPTAVVALGDSAASGEGAGDYEPGTRGEGGNWCHRSVHAYVHRLGVADESVNLACSGAKAADVAFGPGTRDGEGSQAERLGALAARVRVTTVLLQVGGNDEPALVPTGIACIRAFLDPQLPGCRTTVGPRLPARLAAVAPKVEAAVGDVRAALRGAGYADDDYTLVLVSYASPVTEDMPGVPATRGCPYSRPDAEWGRTVVVPALSETLAGVAARTGTRFVALDRATEGREACSRATPRDEWQRRITVDPHALVHGGLDAVGVHLAQESFHPSALGHAEIGRCVGEFLRAGDALPRAAACRVGADGHLHAVPRPAGTADTAAG